MSNSLLGGFQTQSVRYKLHTFKPYARYVAVSHAYTYILRERTVGVTGGAKAYNKFPYTNLF